MKTKFISALFAISSLCFSGCDYDNFEEPRSILSGNVIFEGKPVGVRTNGPQLELWQDGFQLRTLIPVHIEQDGSFSAALFDGQYKLVRKGNSPWLQQASDTLMIQVKGNTAIDVPVIPYFSVSNESYQVANNELIAGFTVRKHTNPADVDVVRLFIGRSILTDQSRNEKAVSLDLSTLVLGTPATIRTQLPEGLKNQGYAFVRLGVKARATGEYSYSQVQKIALK